MYFQSEEIKKKIRQSLVDNHEVDCVLKDPKYKNEAKAVEIRRKRKEQFEIDNNCIAKAKLTKKYDWGWYQAKILTPIFMTNCKDNTSFYRVKDIPKIDAYIEETKNNNHSFKEMKLLWYVQDIYDGEIKHDCKSVIKGKELDIYFPDLNLAIEYNDNVLAFYRDEYSD